MNSSQLSITIREFTLALPALARMFNEARPSDPRVTYRMAKLRRALAAHDAPDAPHNVVRKQLIEAHVVHDEQGQVVIADNQFVFKSDEAQKAFEAGMAAIMDEVIEIAAPALTLDDVAAMNLSMPLSVAEMDTVAWLVREPEGVPAGY